MTSPLTWQPELRASTDRRRDTDTSPDERGLRAALEEWEAFVQAIDAGSAPELTAVGAAALEAIGGAADVRKRLRAQRTGANERPPRTEFITEYLERQGAFDGDDLCADLDRALGEGSGP